MTLTLNSFKFIIRKLPQDIVNYIYSYNDSYRIFFQKNIVPLLLKNSFLFWKRRMYLFTKMNYLTSYKIQLSDFDSFDFNYFLEESDE